MFRILIFLIPFLDVLIIKNSCSFLIAAVYYFLGDFYMKFYLLFSNRYAWFSHFISLIKRKTDFHASSTPLLDAMNSVAFRFQVVIVSFTSQSIYGSGYLCCNVLLYGSIILFRGHSNFRFLSLKSKIWLEYAPNKPSSDSPDGAIKIWLPMPVLVFWT